MKSIQTKLIIMILSSILLSSLVMGSAGIMNSARVVEEDSRRIMNLMSQGSAQDIDALLSRIEQSVNTLTAYAKEQLDDVTAFKTDASYVEQYTKRLQAVAVNAADYTEGALGVYVRYNPQFTSPTSGLFWNKNALGGNFHELEPTDFSRYSPEDAEHVGWYYIPVKNGKATWMLPYQNRNTNVEMISYVVPMFMGEEAAGVVGMDIDFRVVRDIVDEVKVYQSGFAFLTDAEGSILYHKDAVSGAALSSIDPKLEKSFRRAEEDGPLISYEWKGRENLAAFCTLSNGMRLVVSAPASEINAVKTRLYIQMGISFAAIVAVFLLVTVYIARRMIRPLRELTEAAQKIAEGDLSISLTCKSKDEVGELTESFRTTVQQLQKYINYINGLAYRDGLTGVRNKMAYKEAVKHLEEQIHTGQPEFAVVVLDINWLKGVNDTYGHDFGDMLIIDASRIIANAFSHSPVYRIGGDEFVVLLEGGDYGQYPRLLKRLEQETAAYNRTAREGRDISIARGIAVYSGESDLTFLDVFKRADSAMYQNKAATKNSSDNRSSTYIPNAADSPTGK